MKHSAPRPHFSFVAASRGARRSRGGLETDRTTSQPKESATVELFNLRDWTPEKLHDVARDELDVTARLENAA